MDFMAGDDVMLRWLGCLVPEDGRDDDAAHSQATKTGKAHACRDKPSLPASTIPKEMTLPRWLAAGVHVIPCPWSSRDSRVRVRVTAGPVRFVCR